MNDGMTGYKWVVSFYKKDSWGHWNFHDFRTTNDAVDLHIKDLEKQQATGKVRGLEVVPIAEPIALNL